MKNIANKKFWPGIAWFFFVLILLCIPGSKIPKTDNWLTRIYLDKWVHAGLFGILALLWMLPIAKSDLSYIKKQKWIIIIAVVICIWGLITEYIQKYFIPRREFDWWDWAADSLGVLIAVIFVRKK